MKALLADAGIPTAAYGAFDDAVSAEAFLRSMDESAREVLVAPEDHAA